MKCNKLVRLKLWMLWLCGTSLRPLGHCGIPIKNPYYGILQASIILHRFSCCHFMWPLWIHISYYTQFRVILQQLAAPLLKWLSGNVCSLLETLVLVFLYEANIVYFIFQKRKHSCTSVQHGFKRRGQRTGEAMNKGQMVSSTGLCSALQRENPAEFHKHNFFFLIGRVIWV